MKTTMVEIYKNIQLNKVKEIDAAFLYNLMKEIYMNAYSHFWKDRGVWYVRSQYSQEVILRELLEPQTDYYFVIYKEETVGVLRIVWDKKLKGLHEQKQVKLHRIYLSHKAQGKGIGKKLLSWLEAKAIKKGYQIIWLDAMDYHKQAVQFYKKIEYTYFSHVFLPYELLYDKVRKMNQMYKVLKR